MRSGGEKIIIKYIIHNIYISINLHIVEMLNDVNISHCAHSAYS